MRFLCVGDVVATPGMRAAERWLPDLIHRTKADFVIVNGEKTKNFWNGSVRCDKTPLRIKIRNICGDETVWEV